MAQSISGNLCIVTSIVLLDAFQGDRTHIHVLAGFHQNLASDLEYLAVIKEKKYPVSLVR